MTITRADVVRDPSGFLAQSIQRARLYVAMRRS